MRRGTREQWPDWFGKLVSYWHRNHSVVITLNYDTLIERCVVGQYLFTNGEVAEGRWFWSWLYPVPLTPVAPIMGDQGVAGDPETVQLFKLHGSVNWFYSGTTSFSGEPVYCLPVDVWKDDSSQRNKGLDAAVSGKTPLVIPPLTEKTQYFQNQIVRRIWQRAGNEPLMAQRVFILGYSLPETDLTFRFFLSQTMRILQDAELATTQYWVADLNKEVVARLRSAIHTDLKISTKYAGVASPIPSLANAIVSQAL